jgi:hypothetical protein
LCAAAANIAAFSMTLAPAYATGGSTVQQGTLQLIQLD